jgi:hypothetical protein
LKLQAIRDLARIPGPVVVDVEINPAVNFSGAAAEFCQRDMRLVAHGTELNLVHFDELLILSAINRVGGTPWSTVHKHEAVLLDGRAELGQLYNLAVDPFAVDEWCANIHELERRRADLDQGSTLNGAGGYQVAKSFLKPHTAFTLEDVIVGGRGHISGGHRIRREEARRVLGIAARFGDALVVRANRI